MFTGIVSAVGRIESVSSNGGSGTGDGGRVLRIRAPYRGLKKGESIAVNGACLTVEKVAKGAFTVHAVQTTLRRTLIGEWQKGGSVNLERAVRAADRCSRAGRGRRHDDSARRDRGGRREPDGERVAQRRRCAAVARAVHARAYDVGAAQIR